MNTGMSGSRYLCLFLLSTDLALCDVTQFYVQTETDLEISECHPPSFSHEFGVLNSLVLGHIGYLNADAGTTVCSEGGFEAPIDYYGYEKRACI